MARKKAVIHFGSCHETGNIYWIMAKVRDQMRKERRITDWNNAYERITDKENRKNYAEALAILRELVDLIDDDGVH